MTEKTYVPVHKAPVTISEVITSLEYMKNEYGDLPIELCTSPRQGDVRYYQDIFYSSGTYEDGSEFLIIQSFPY